jgi:hypothetical protein
MGDEGSFDARLRRSAPTLKPTRRVAAQATLHGHPCAADGRVATRNYIGVLSTRELLGHRSRAASPTTSRANHPAHWPISRTSTAWSR